MLDPGLLQAGLAAFAASSALETTTPQQRRDILKTPNFDDPAFRAAIAQELGLLSPEAHEILISTMDFRFDQDFSDVFYHRHRVSEYGGWRYIRPAGGLKYGMSVENKYGDSEWLKEDEDGWAVAYHGTTSINAQGILKEGFNKDKIARDAFRAKFASKTVGIYCAPDPKTALAYANPFIYKEKQYQLIYQLRVRPTAIQYIPHAETQIGDYYRIERQEDIRAVGICIFPAGVLNHEYFILKDTVVKPPPMPIVKPSPMPIVKPAKTKKRAALKKKKSAITPKIPKVKSPKKKTPSPPPKAPSPPPKKKARSPSPELQIVYAKVTPVIDLF